jgi:hypothetical protein
LFIAERNLLYSEKGSDVRRPFSIRIGRPYLVREGMVDYAVGEGFAGCSISIDGLDRAVPDVFGIDSIQAISIASNLEPFLKRLQRDYDVFWASGEPYFDD